MHRNAPHSDFSFFNGKIQLKPCSSPEGFLMQTSGAFMGHCSFHKIKAPQITRSTTEWSRNLAEQVLKGLRRISMLVTLNYYSDEEDDSLILHMPFHMYNPLIEFVPKKKKKPHLLN